MRDVANRLVIVLFFAAVLSFAVNAQQANEQKIVVEFKIMDVGSAEIEIILSGNEAYLPSKSVFNILGVKADTDAVNQHFEGFFRSGDSTFSIDLPSGRANYAGNPISINPNDYLREENTTYFRVDFLNALFNLDMKYLPRRLRVELKRSHDLPIFFAERRKQAIRRSQNRMTFPDVEMSYGRQFDALSGARLDWIGTSRFSKQSFIGSRYTLSLGMMVFGGEFTGRMISASQPHLTRNDYRARIRFPIFGSPAVRQIVIGDFVSSGLLSREVTGVEITNRPPSIRRVFAREVFSSQFDPNVDVTLGGGIDGNQYQQTNDLGMFQMDAPILYGQGLMEVHAYDQWGRERVLQYRMNIPRTLIPPGELEYSVSAGRIRPPSNMMESANYLSWGLSSDLTVGAKLDYYDTPGEVAKVYPGLSATARMLKGLIFDGLIVPSAYSRVGFDWLFPSTANVVLNHSRFGRNSYFNPTKMTDETNLTVTVPIDIAAARYSLSTFIDRVHYLSFRDDELQLSLSAFISVFTPRYSFRVIERSLYADGNQTQSKLSAVSLGILLPASLLFRGEIDYNHLSGGVESINADAVKTFSNGLLVGLSYFRIPVLESYTVALRLEYFFPYARVQSAVATSGPSQYQYAVSASGSVGLSVPTSKFYFENHPNYVGYGGYVVHPFLDANGNGVADPGEQTIEKGRVYFSNLAVGGLPHVLSLNSFNSDRIVGYEEYNLYLDPQSLDNPIWVPQFGTVRIMSEPNYIKRIDIPIVNGGFVRGIITVNAQPLRPAENIKVTLTAQSVKDRGVRKFSRSVTTFSTGEFEFSAIPPGKYILQLDQAQLDALGYTASPPLRDIVIVVKPDGDVIADQDFRLNVK